MKKFIECIKSIDAGTVVRTLILTMAYINQIVALIGMQSFASSYPYQIISLAFTLIISIISAWKNNNFTHIAQVAGKVFTALKDGKLTEDEIDQILQKADEQKPIE